MTLAVSVSIAWSWNTNKMEKQHHGHWRQGFTQHIAVGREGKKNLTLRQNERSPSEGKQHCWFRHRLTGA
jgi:hypothetical protein